MSNPLPCDEMQATELREMPPDLATVVLLGASRAQIYVYAKTRNIARGDYKCPQCEEDGIIQIGVDENKLAIEAYCPTCNGHGVISINHKSLLDSL